MLPSEIPRLDTDPPVRVFPGVWKLLSFLRLPSPDGFRPSLFCLSFYLLYFVLPPWEGCLSGCLKFSSSIRSCFVEFSVFKCSFNEFWGRKWSPRLIPPPSRHSDFRVWFHNNVL